MTTSQIPTTGELVRRAAELAPLLRKRASWIEENRRLADDVLEALADAGVFKMRVPVRYGGYESDVRTVSRVVAELARGDGSTAWTVAVWSISTWIAGLFPDSTQDEIFSGPDVREGVASHREKRAPKFSGGGPF